MKELIRRGLMSGSILGFVSLASSTAAGAVLGVGPAGPYAKPCAAFAAATDGDTIEIDGQGDYAGDVCAIAKSRLTIRGVGGRPEIAAAGESAQGKAIWVVQGDDTTIENIEFSGAAVPDQNGAGIRQEGTNLTVRGCVFRDNENGILASDNADSEILIEQSEFDGNGAGDGYSHNLYINHVRKLVFRYNWSHRARVGHLLKSRAAENYVTYNRISGEDGSSSYELDFPNGGRTIVMGNLIQQSATTENPTILAYLEEGASAENPNHQLYVVNNTFVNERSAGRFLQVAEGAEPAVVVNNVLSGTGDSSYPAGSRFDHNVQEDAAKCLTNAEQFDYRLVAGSKCVDAGTDAGSVGDVALSPTEHYRHPADHTTRRAVGAVDVGAYELEDDEPANASGGSSGAGGSQVSPGGAAGAGGGASSGAGAGPASAAAEHESGCSCRVAGPQERVPAWSALLFVGAAWAMRRGRTARARALA